jgi:threonine/homoserine efflux transporter RhtA
MTEEKLQIAIYREEGLKNEINSLYIKLLPGVVIVIFFIGRIYFSILILERNTKLIWESLQIIGASFLGWMTAMIKKDK